MIGAIEGAKWWVGPITGRVISGFLFFPTSGGFLRGFCGFILVLLFVLKFF
jgi:hypothetical protein